MTMKQLERLAQLLTDTAQTASTIELRALAGGRADDGIVAMAAGLRANCTSCLVLVDGLMQEGCVVSEFDDSKRAALERQGWHCLRCGTNIHDPSCWPGRSGHHRQLRRAADPDVRHSPANIVELCGSGTTGCHGWVHQHVAEAERLGLIVPFGADPRDVPVFDWEGRWLRLNMDGTATPLTQTEIILLRTKGNQ